MFLHLSVILFMGGVWQTPAGQTPPWADTHPPWPDTPIPLPDTPLDRHPPPMARHSPGQTLHWSDTPWEDPLPGRPPSADVGVC